MSPVDPPEHDRRSFWLTAVDLKPRCKNCEWWLHGHDSLALDDAPCRTPGTLARFQLVVAIRNNDHSAECYSYTRNTDDITAARINPDLKYGPPLDVDDLKSELAKLLVALRRI